MQPRLSTPGPIFHLEELAIQFFPQQLPGLVLQAYAFREPGVVPRGHPSAREGLKQPGRARTRGPVRVVLVRRVVAGDVRWEARGADRVPNRGELQETVAELSLFVQARRWPTRQRRREHADQLLVTFGGDQEPRVYRPLQFPRASAPAAATQGKHPAAPTWAQPIDLARPRPPPGATAGGSGSAARAAAPARQRDAYLILRVPPRFLVALVTQGRIRVGGGVEARRTREGGDIPSVSRRPPSLGAGGVDSPALRCGAPPEVAGCQLGERNKRRRAGTAWRPWPSDFPVLQVGTSVEGAPESRPGPDAGSRPVPLTLGAGEGAGGGSATPA